MSITAVPPSEVDSPSWPDIDLPVISSAASDLQLTVAIERYVLYKKTVGSASMNILPYGEKLDFVVPLLKGREWRSSCTVQNGNSRYTVLIYGPYPKDEIKGVGTTLARAICFALLQDSGKVIIQAE